MAQVTSNCRIPIGVGGIWTDCVDLASSALCPGTGSADWLEPASWPPQSRRIVALTGLRPRGRLNPGRASPPPPVSDTPL